MKKQVQLFQCSLFSLLELTPQGYAIFNHLFSFYIIRILFLSIMFVTATFGLIVSQISNYNFYMNSIHSYMVSLIVRKVLYNSTLFKLPSNFSSSFLSPKSLCYYCHLWYYSLKWCVLRYVLFYGHLFYVLLYL